jgi:hypothetical protein
VKFLKENITSVLLIIVAVLVTLQISSMFRRAPAPVDNREEIKAVQAERDYYRGKFDSVISAGKQRDTVWIKETVQLKTQYEKIRPTVESYSSNELLRRANGWQPE